MKKFFAIICAVLYLGTSAGATLHLHYCMGELAGWSLGMDESRTCSSCGMEKSSEKSNGCCNDEVRFLKNDVDQKITESPIQTPATGYDAVAIIPQEGSDLSYFSLADAPATGHAKLRCSRIPIHVRNCVFRI
jgi:hypothetical protein